MKTLSRILLALIVSAVICLLFTGCYTKKQALKKFCKQDTISTFVTLHDTIRTQTIQADTSFSDTVDTVVVERDRLVIKYVKKNGIVYLQGKCKGDTIYVDKEVKVSVPVIIPKCPELHWYEKYWYVFAIAAVFGSLILWLKR